MSFIKTSLKAIETQNPDLHKYLTKNMFYELLYIIPAVIITELAGTYLYCRNYNLSLSILTDENLFSFLLAHILIGLVIICAFLFFNYRLLTILNHKEHYIWYISMINNSKKGRIKHYCLHPLSLLSSSLSLKFLFFAGIAWLIIKIPAVDIFYSYISDILSSKNQSFIATILCISLASITTTCFLKRLSKKIYIPNKLKVDDFILFSYLFVLVYDFIINLAIIEILSADRTDISIIEKNIFAALYSMIYTYAVTSLNLLKNITSKSKYEFSLKIHSTILIFFGSYFYGFVYQETICPMQNIEMWCQKNPSKITQSKLLLDRVSYFVTYDRKLKYSKVYQKSTYDWQPVLAEEPPSKN